MHPVLFRLGSFTISTFGIMMVAGFFVGWVILTREFARKGVAPQDAQTAVLIAAFGGVLGSKLYYLLDHWDELSRDAFGMITSRGGLTPRTMAVPRVWTTRIGSPRRAAIECSARSLVA